MRFYIVVTALVLGMIGFGFLSLVAIGAAIGLTLLIDPTQDEMKSKADSTMRMTTIGGGIVLILFGHWIIAPLFAVFYLSYTARFNVMVQRMKGEQTINNDVETPVENEVN